MDYDTLSESSNANTPLAARLNSALNVNSTESETVGEQQPSEGTIKDSTTVDNVTDENKSERRNSNDNANISVTDNPNNSNNTEQESECYNPHTPEPYSVVTGRSNDDHNLVTESVNTTESGRLEQASDDSDVDFVSDESESDGEYESADEGEEDKADQQNLQELEDRLTDEQKEEKRINAQTMKESGNELFRSGSYKSAIRTYSRALRECPLKFPKDRAIMYSNRAACKMRMEDLEPSIQDCTKALDLHPTYLKALMRRAELYEKTDKLDEALADHQKIVELDPSQHASRAACMKLPDQIKERNEKLKEEMMGKLKDLGNMVLRPFGLSTNNFQLNQDPNSGGYSVNFVQNPQQNS